MRNHGAKELWLVPLETILTGDLTLSSTAAVTFLENTAVGKTAVGKTHGLWSKGG